MSESNEDGKKKPDRDGPIDGQISIVNTQGNKKVKKDE